MDIKCHRCKHEWDYSGNKSPKSKYSVFVVCPNCRTSVNLKKQEEEEEDE